MEALDLMQKDPTAAQQKYKDDKKVLPAVVLFGLQDLTHRKQVRSNQRAARING